jgi:triacylglycerol lipase
MNARVLAAAAVVFALLAADPAKALAASPGPPLLTPRPVLAAALSCPSVFHHSKLRPVLLVHGTSLTVDENWGWTYAPTLSSAGYDVCTVQMPEYAFVDVQVSVEYVVYAIREVARRSHQRISVVGVSQGGVEPRMALKWWPDIHNLMASYVGMATPNHGATFGASCVYNCVPAVWQQRQNSNLLDALNSGTETPYNGTVAYTSVYSLTDDIIQPAAPAPTAALQGGTNIAVQDICPGRYVGHIQSIWDAAYYAVVIDALSHNGPAVAARVDRSFCNQMAMPGVNPIQGWVMTAELYGIAGERQTVYPGRTTSEPPLRCYATPAGCSDESAPAGGFGGSSNANAGDAYDRGAPSAGGSSSSSLLPALSAPIPGSGLP